MESAAPFATRQQVIDKQTMSLPILCEGTHLHRILTCANVGPPCGSEHVAATRLTTTSLCSTLPPCCFRWDVLPLVAHGNSQLLLCHAPGSSPNRRMPTDTTSRLVKCDPATVEALKSKALIHQIRLNQTTNPWQHNCLVRC